MGVDGLVWKEIWKSKVPQKIKIFLWKACQNILPLGENMFKRRLVVQNVCPICHKEPETLEHMFLLCDWVRPVWFGSQFQVVPRREEITSFHQWFG